MKRNDPVVENNDVPEKEDEKDEKDEEVIEKSETKSNNTSIFIIIIIIILVIWIPFEQINTQIFLITKQPFSD